MGNSKSTLCSNDIIEYCKNNGGIIDDRGYLVFITNITMMGRPAEIVLQIRYDMIEIIMTYNKVQNIRIGIALHYGSHNDIEELFRCIAISFRKEIYKINSKNTSEKTVFRRKTIK